MGDVELATALRRRGIADEAVLRVMGQLSRIHFVPEYPDQATGDYPLPIGYGQTISQPYVVAAMTEALRLQPGDRVLEIGTGSGYQAAILSLLGAQVFSIEVIPQLYERAARVLRMLDLPAHLKLGDGYRGWPEHAPFDGIILTAAPREVPHKLLEQLALGGRMVAPIGELLGGQELYVIEKDEGGQVSSRSVFGVRFVPMVEGDDAGSLPPSGATDTLLR